MNKQLAILEEVYGPTEWSESALVSILRVMQLTREDERIRQMEEMIEFRNMIVRQCAQKLENDGMVEVAMEIKQHFGVDIWS